MLTVASSVGFAGSARHLEGRWGWFVALGVGLLVAGGIASVNLFLSTLASIIYIAAMMLVGGIMQMLHAFTSHGWKRRALYALSAIFYAVASAIMVYDPILAAVWVSLVIGVLLIASGLIRLFAGFRDRSRKGWIWIAASGVLTLTVGAIVLWTWPVVGLLLLGALLTVDLIFQGWSYVAFGLGLRAKIQNSKLRPV
ncbi:HdeD family acid-resistance protein (plasmid) [Rhizobium sp. CC1099]|uniref:HdeD family acid-resistance protein n=1 Tax=Rhizobium sp. CC1099 TaxID=3039160 RepID=UPI0024B21D79|nr:HdeD family acid-resistance protein [Rhizobium sp. CC1099]WFU91403.1 HdeD family acid-resistance protein [Rhizobium sp. CC1099]